MRWLLGLVPTRFALVSAVVAASIAVVGWTLAIGAELSAPRSIAVGSVCGMCVGVPVAVFLAVVLEERRIGAMQRGPRSGVDERRREGHRYAMVSGMGRRLAVSSTMAMGGIGVTKAVVENDASAMGWMFLGAAIAALGWLIQFLFLGRGARERGWRW